MELEEFALGESWVHKLDPRAKILVTGVFSVAVALNDHVWSAAVSFLAPAALILCAGLDLKKVLKRLAVVNGFVAFMWLFLPFTVPGETIYRLGPLSVQREGLDYALLITLKSNSIILMVMALLGTSGVFALVRGMRRLGVPDKLAQLFFFCFRYVHVIHAEYHRLTNAMKMRGFRPKTNTFTYKAYAYLVGMLLVRSFDRSKRILQAMKCRGFKGQFYILRRQEMRPPDYVLTGSGIAFSILLWGLM